MYIEELFKLPYEKFIKKLGDDVASDKVKAIIKSGKYDGLPDDEKITFSHGIALCKNLIPCQQQLLIESSIKWSIMSTNLDMIKNILSGKPTAVNNKPVLTLNGKYILDGHHRWVESYLLNPESKIVILDMKLDIKPIDALKIIQLSIAANKGEIPASTPKGTNMFTVSEDIFKSFITKNVTDKILELFNKDKHDLANQLWDNLIMLRKLNKHIKGAPDRVYMPQPAKAKGSIEDLKYGNIDYKKPFTISKNRIPSFNDFSTNYVD